ncbi:MAG: hypothetical protein R3B70_18555 [Polyangiaceae bacterium]
MDVRVFDSRQLDIVFRTLRTALSPSGDLSEEERAFLRTYAEICGTLPPRGAPLPILASDVDIEGEHARKRLVQLSAIAAMLHRPVRPASAAFVKELSAKLGVKEPVVPVLDALAKGRRGLARLLTARRGLLPLLREAREAEGMWGVARFVGSLVFGAPVNKDKHLRYKRLGLLPEGTLGREYWKHLTELGYGFPGEAGGIADSVAYHDVGHVLTDFDTTPMGEIQQGAFQGGNRRQDGFFFVQFVMLQFHHGIQLTPVAKPEVGYFDPRRVLWAIHRGAECNVDITHQWNFWPLMSLELEDARERCGLIPKMA